MASKNGRPSISPTVPPISTRHEVHAFVAAGHELLDGVGDGRNDLHGSAEVTAAALAGQDVLVDAAGGDVVGFARRNAGEALVVAEIEIGLGAVVGDEHLAVLIGAHRSGVDIRDRGRAYGDGRYTRALAEAHQGRLMPGLFRGGDHAAGNEDVPLYGL